MTMTIAVAMAIAMAMAMAMAIAIAIVMRAPQGFWGNKLTWEIWQWKQGKKAKNS